MLGTEGSTTTLGATQAPMPSFKLRKFLHGVLGLPQDYDSQQARPRPVLIGGPAWVSCIVAASTANRNEESSSETNPGEVGRISSGFRLRLWLRPHPRPAEAAVSLTERRERGWSSLGLRSRGGGGGRTQLLRELWAWLLPSLRGAGGYGFATRTQRGAYGALWSLRPHPRPTRPSCWYRPLPTPRPFSWWPLSTPAPLLLTIPLESGPPCLPSLWPQPRWQLLTYLLCSRTLVSFDFAAPLPTTQTLGPRCPDTPDSPAAFALRWPSSCTLWPVWFSSISNPLSSSPAQFPVFQHLVPGLPKFLYLHHSPSLDPKDPELWPFRLHLGPFPLTQALAFSICDHQLYLAGSS